MITSDKLKIYQYYNGGADGISRVGTEAQMYAIDDDDWLMIDNLLQDLYMAQNKFCSKEYSERVELELLSNCDNIKTIVEVRLLSTKRY